MRTRTRGSPSWPTISHRKAGYVFADCSVHPTQTACRRGGPYVALTNAMGKAPEEIRSAAHYISTSNDKDGIADAIDAFLLPLVGGSS
ncbi:HAD family hydrolase [Sphingobium lactosutens]|nr:HAD family hydrolase [Sphingobium lactosutens]